MKPWGHAVQTILQLLVHLSCFIRFLKRQLTSLPCSWRITWREVRGMGARAPASAVPQVPGVVDSGRREATHPTTISSPISDWSHISKLEILPFCKKEKQTDSHPLQGTMAILLEKAELFFFPPKVGQYFLPHVTGCSHEGMVRTIAMNEQPGFQAVPMLGKAVTA